MKPSTPNMLTKKQLITLCLIRGGQLTLLGVAETMGLSYSTVRIRILRLQELGLVRQIAARRQEALLRLTPAGRVAVSKIVLIRYQDGRVEVGRVEVMP